MTKELKPSLAMRAADAVKWEGWEAWAELSLEEFAAEVIRLSDAERGKVAVAWLNAAGDMSYIYGPYNPTDRPLFLSPTIPEGMVLVRIEPTTDMKVAWKMKDPNWENSYRAMLDAAQGERNA